jgi:hypothetical protein
MFLNKIDEIHLIQFIIATTMRTTTVYSRCDDPLYLNTLQVPAGCESCNLHKICCYFIDQAGRYSCVINNVELELQSITGNHATVNGKIYTDANVTAVYFKNSILSRVPKLVFEKFPNTEFLSIPNSQLVDIDDNMFELCQNLKSLDVSENLISRIGKTSLQKCQKLETLDLSGNPIAGLESDIFKLGLQLKTIFLRKF